MRKIPKLPKVNWKLLVIMLLLIVVVVALVRFVPKMIFKGDKEVTFVVLSKEQIPEKINEILPKYKMLERALAAEIDDTIYVIVTRGEKLTGGYDLDIEKLEVVKESEETKLVVHAIFKDPKPDDIVSQAITHPYVVAKTELEKLPQKIELKVTYKE